MLVGHNWVSVPGLEPGHGAKRSRMRGGPCATTYSPSVI